MVWVQPGLDSDEEEESESLAETTPPAIQVSHPFRKYTALREILSLCSPSQMSLRRSDRAYVISVRFSFFTLID